MKSETTNPLKDGPCGLTGDGTVSSHQAQVKGKDGKHVRFQGVKDMDPVKWFYPLDSFFLERCTWSWFISDFVAKSQAHLDSGFKMVVEDFIPGKPGQGKHQKSCRAKSEPSPNGGTPASADADVDDEEVKPKIQLATKSHHTEHSS